MHQLLVLVTAVPASGLGVFFSAYMTNPDLRRFCRNQLFRRRDRLRLLESRVLKLENALRDSEHSRFELWASLEALQEVLEEDRQKYRSKISEGLRLFVGQALREVRRGHDICEVPNRETVALAKVTLLKHLRSAASKSATVA